MEDFLKRESIIRRGWKASIPPILRGLWLSCISKKSGSFAWPFGKLRKELSGFPKTFWVGHTGKANSKEMVGIKSEGLPPLTRNVPLCAKWCGPPVKKGLGETI